MEYDSAFFNYEILCVISLIYYVFVTEKIFFKRLSIIKGFLLVLVSPLCSLLLASSAVILYDSISVTSFHLKDLYIMIISQTSE